MVMHRNFEGPAVFEMLYKALGVAHSEKKAVEERNIRILIGQMHLVKVIVHGVEVYSFSCSRIVCCNFLLLSLLLDLCYTYSVSTSVVVLGFKKTFNYVVQY